MTISHAHKVSILVPSFNGKQLLAENLPSVITAVENYRGTCEVIIIDDASTDGTEGFIKSNFAEVKTVRLEDTSGYAMACNCGTHFCDGEILIFLNNDVKVDLNFIDPLVEHFKDESVFAVGSKSITPKKGYLNETISHGFFKNGILVFEYSGRNTHPDFFDKPRSILHVCGAAFACRRDRFLNLGGFDTIFRPIYWEDVDLSYRAWKRGWQSIYEPKSIVYHMHSSTVNNFYSKDYIKYISRRNRLLFYWKNITDPGLMLRHILWLPLWMGQNILKEDIGWIKSFNAALSLLGNIRMRRRKERLEAIWSDAKIINLTKIE